MIRARCERCQRSHVLQVDWPPAPLATKSGARPRGGTLVTRPRPEHCCPQRSTPVSLQLTAHVTAVVALDICCNPHRHSLPVLAVRSLNHRTAPACESMSSRLDGSAGGYRLDDRVKLTPRTERMLIIEKRDRVLKGGF